MRRSEKVELVSEQGTRIQATYGSYLQIYSHIGWKLASEVDNLPDGKDEPEELFEVYTPDSTSAWDDDFDEGRTDLPINGVFLDEEDLQED